jgi:hypothetical protein
MLRHFMLKTTSKYEQILRKAKFIISFASSSCLLLDGSADRISRELWWTNQFPLVDIIPPWLSMLIWVMNNRSVGGCSSETYPHPINIIMCVNFVHSAVFRCFPFVPNTLLPIDSSPKKGS